MQITIKLSESLLSIYKTSGVEFEETFMIDTEGAVTIKEILNQAGISPMLTPMIIVNNKACSSLNEVIDEASTITLIGPLAGG
ncbi:MoaD/ThiS family protein [Acidaminobacter hydrogenoformans]|uniref:ThiS family protein n=1 Tax=Acidaminobacter hydrogenoformans DSM 2784 TaxID=1120920 RepID=A0A1G5S1L2_9FIRM|nr:MoaD/ThiS family protein [Acidaminobacter hydrogenoformans]SCZ80275.1 hypothetical protein SAMN03080599_02190 [Acidaminobacter hydrogenoformans DSM 2784]